MFVVMCSGSCRLLGSMNKINKGWEAYEKKEEGLFNLHLFISNFIGLNFLVKCHTTREQIHEDEKKHIITAASFYKDMNNVSLSNESEALHNIRAFFSNINYFIFEISSIKNYISKKTGLYYQMELLPKDPNQYILYKQNENDITNDLIYLANYLQKPIFVIPHFDTGTVLNRKIIINGLKKASNMYPTRIHFIDINILMANNINNLTYDSLHLTDHGLSLYGMFVEDQIYNFHKQIKN